MQFKLIDLLLILFRNKKIFIVNFMLFSVVSAVISLVLPHWYTSTARLMPPETQSSGLFGLASMALDLPFDVPGIAGLTTGPADIYIAVLRSRNVRTRIIERFNLQDYFEADFLEDALGQLDSRTFFDKTEEGLIVISCWERTPEFAQKLTQAFLEELDRVNIEVRKTSATYTREFIEKRLKEAEADMAAAAQRMVDFQRKNGAFDIETQVKSQIELSAQLRAQMVSLEIQRDVLQTYLQESHQELKTVRLQVAEMRKHLERLQQGISPIENDLILAMQDVPELYKQFLFIQRDIEVQKVIYQLLMQQYEQARIQEKKDSPTIQVLDAPTLPQKRSSPKRTLIVVTSALASILLSFIIVWVREMLAWLAENDRQKYDDFMRAVKNLHRLRSTPGER